MKLFSTICTVILLLMMGSCDSSKKTDPAQQPDSDQEKATGTLKIGLTDAPAAANFEKVMVTFDKITVSKSESEDDEGGWITVNEEGGSFDLLELNNGKLADLVTSKLDIGTYNQIRFYITAGSVVVDGKESALTVPSSMLRTVHPFTIAEDTTTELIADFDAARSIVTTGNDSYLLKPVIRLVNREETGDATGDVEPIEDKLITVTTYKQDESALTRNGTVAYSGTTVTKNGEFTLAFMEPGTYSITLEVEGYDALKIDDVRIKVGQSFDITKEFGKLSFQKASGELKIGLTDAPAAANFEKVMITFDKITVSKSESEDDDGEWVTVNEKGGSFDLLELNNGKLADLVTSQLAVGTYNQIRFYTTEAKTVVDGKEHDMKIPSTMLRTVTPFTIEKDKTTELILDFDAARSIVKTGNGNFILKPVIRLVKREETGDASGDVEPVDDKLITATAYEQGTDTVAYCGTTVTKTGEFTLGFMEAGHYSVTLEVEGYEAIKIDDVNIKVGESFDISKEYGKLSFTK